MFHREFATKNVVESVKFVTNQKEKREMSRSIVDLQFILFILFLRIFFPSNLLSWNLFRFTQIAKR